MIGCSGPVGWPGAGRPRSADPATQTMLVHLQLAHVITQGCLRSSLIKETGATVNGLLMKRCAWSFSRPARLIDVCGTYPPSLRFRALARSMFASRDLAMPFPDYGFGPLRCRTTRASQNFAAANRATCSEPALSMQGFHSALRECKA